MAYFFTFFPATRLEKLTWGKTIPKKRAGRRRKKEGFVDTQDGYDPMILAQSPI